jgi:hypothetical protein
MPRPDNGVGPSDCIPLVPLRPAPGCAEPFALSFTSHAHISERWRRTRRLKRQVGIAAHFRDRPSDREAPGRSATPATRGAGLAAIATISIRLGSDFQNWLLQNGAARRGLSLAVFVVLSESLRGSGAGFQIDGGFVSEPASVPTHLPSTPAPTDCDVPIAERADGGTGERRPLRRCRACGYEFSRSEYGECCSGRCVEYLAAGFPDKATQ